MRIRHATSLLFAHLFLVKFQRQKYAPKEENAIQEQHSEYRWAKGKVDHCRWHPQFPICQHGILVIGIQLLLHVIATIATLD